MPQPSPVRVVKRLITEGYNAERAAVTLLVQATDTEATVRAVLERMNEGSMTVTKADVEAVLDTEDARTETENGTDIDTSEVRTEIEDEGEKIDITEEDGSDRTNVSGGANNNSNRTIASGITPERKGVDQASDTGDRTDPEPVSPTVRGDVTGQSTGTGTYADFVSVFRDRYDRLSKLLRGRVNHRPTDALESMPGGSAAALIGLVTDVRSTRNGHHLVEFEDTNGTFPVLVMKDRPYADSVDELLLDEVIAVEGTLADDSGILFADALHFPDVPRTFEPTTADRHVRAALVSDLHVGSQEFLEGVWTQFTDWLHTQAAEAVEYLLIAGDMVEGVGVYPDQDEELDVVDIYEQYELFAEHLKPVPGDIEIVMIPGNHDAVRLAEPQPGFETDLREIMSAHDATISGNPSIVDLEGVSVLMYHGVSIDELVAELPLESVSYETPARAMAQLLKKRHLAPTFGGKNRLAPEKRDYLVIEEVPDVFHSGHVHKLGVDAYQSVRLVNSGCFQGQTSFQRSVNISPDTGTVPIVDLDTLEVTVRKFA